MTFEIIILLYHLIMFVQDHDHFVFFEYKLEPCGKITSSVLRFLN